MVIKILLAVASVLYVASVIMDGRVVRELREQNRLLREEIRILRYGEDGLHG